jgi:hypothetical protein
VALGAIQAVERSKGAYGLDLLIENGLDHPWAHVSDEATKAVGRITGEDYSRRDAESIRGWWKTNGTTFVAARRKEAASSR